MNETADVNPVKKQAYTITDVHIFVSTSPRKRLDTFFKDRRGGWLDSEAELGTDFSTSGRMLGFEQPLGTLIDSSRNGDGDIEVHARVLEILRLQFPRCRATIVMML